MILFLLIFTFMRLDQLEVYNLALELSHNCWEIYQNMDWRIKKIIGDQFMRSTDSVGANIAEGFGRFHFLDKIKFYYTSRGSISESKHWLNLMLDRKILDQSKFNELNNLLQAISIKLSNLISITYKQKE